MIVKCRNCVNLCADWCDMKADSPDPDMERECHWFAQMTNADRIRSMTDEELAGYIRVFFPEICPPVNCPGEDYCYNCWLDWLKQEVSDAGDNN